MLNDRQHALLLGELRLTQERVHQLQRAIEAALQDQEFTEPDRWIDILRDVLKEPTDD